MTADMQEVALSTSNRIKQLNEIDRDVVNLLRSAGLAVKTLTRSLNAPNGDLSMGPFTSVDEQKESFASATSAYFATLSAIDVRLRRQIHALEEAKILPAEASAKDIQTARSTFSGDAAQGTLNAQPSRSAAKGMITGGGLGSLDVGWLNSRNDYVGKEKEAELWEEAQTLVGKTPNWLFPSRSDSQDGSG
ncbi:hypothetical protein ACLMJK_006656 [Lecanora helva]